MWAWVCWPQDDKQAIADFVILGPVPGDQVAQPARIDHLEPVTRGTD